MASPGAAAAPAPTVFGQPGVWHNLTSWTVQHLKSSVNVTRYAPSLEDLMLAGPRMLTRLGNIISFPDPPDGFGQRVIPDPTGSDFFITTTTASDMAVEVSDVAANLANVLEDDQDPAALVSRFSMEGGAKGLGSVFSYATSKWAICCIAMVRLCLPLALPLPFSFIWGYVVGIRPIRESDALGRLVTNGKCN